jgi:hypothetical protein
MTNKEQDIPYFIRIRGCNNCKVHHKYITNAGTYCEEVHPLHASFVHGGCVEYGYSIEEPFVEPAVHMRVGAHFGSDEALDEAKKIIVRFHDYYDSEGNLLPWVVEVLPKEKDIKQSIE